MSDSKNPLPTSKLWEQLIKATSVKQFIGQNESKTACPLLVSISVLYAKSAVKCRCAS